MNNILSMEDFLIESKEYNFSYEQIKESLEYLNSEDPAVLEAWYNTILDFAALIPGVGSVAEGINLVSYAKQGEYLLAALCAIGLIPLFGQYIGAGGSLLVKALGKGASIGKNILTPLINLVAKFFPRIVGFLKSAKFATKFSGITPYISSMIKALKGFITGGGVKIAELAKDAAKIKSLKGATREIKSSVKVGKWLLGGNKNSNDSGDSSKYQIPVPKDAYLSYRGVPLSNIRPYTDTEISQAETSRDWSESYL